MTPEDWLRSISLCHGGPAVLCGSNFCDHKEATIGIREAISKILLLRLQHILEACTAQHRLIVAERELLQNTLSGTVKLLLELLNLQNSGQYQLDQKIRDRAKLLYKAVTGQSSINLELAAMLAPIGRLTLPHELQLKIKSGEKLDQTELSLVDSCREISAQLVSMIPRLGDVADIIRASSGSSAEKAGVPLKDEIKLEAGTLAVIEFIEEQSRGGATPEQILGSVQKKWATSFPQLVGILTSNPGLTPNKSETEIHEFPVDLKGLTPGQMLTRPVKSKAGVLLLSEGFLITPAVIVRLRNNHEASGIILPLYVNSLTPTAG